MGRGGEKKEEKRAGEGRDRMGNTGGESMEKRRVGGEDRGGMERKAREGKGRTPGCSLPPGVKSCIKHWLRQFCVTYVVVAYSEC